MEKKFQYALNVGEKPHLQQFDNILVTCKNIIFNVIVLQYFITNSIGMETCYFSDAVLIVSLNIRFM